MARRSLLFLPVVIAAVVVASASASTSARDPLSERIQLTKADNALATRSSLRASDLPAGWKHKALPPSSDASCPGYRPDLSSITITGRQSRTFGLPRLGLQVESLVEVYATLEQSQKDWKLSATSAAVECLGSMLAEDPSIRLLSARLLPGPPLGEASAKFAFVMSVKSPSGRVPVHADVLFVRQGRVIAGLITTSPIRSVPGQQLLLARLVSRMEKPTSSEA
jgi:hypothetical protein